MKLLVVKAEMENLFIQVHHGPNYHSLWMKDEFFCHGIGKTKISYTEALTVILAKEE